VSFETSRNHEHITQLPDPVSPTMTRTWCAAIAARRSSRKGYMGRLRRCSAIFSRSDIAEARAWAARASAVSAGCSSLASSALSAASCSAAGIVPARMPSDMKSIASARRYRAGLRRRMAYHATPTNLRRQGRTVDERGPLLQRQLRLRGCDRPAPACEPAQRVV